MAEYYSAEEIVKGDFLFISYKHDDHDTVFAIVDGLLALGVRVWCDADLRAGDDWNERVRRLIEHPCCKGVVFFNSVTAFMSAPIAKERDITKKKRQLCMENGKPFLVLPVNIGKPSTMRLLKSAFASVADDDTEIDYKLPLESINDIVDLFNNKTLYVYADGDNTEDCVSALFGAIERSAPTAIDVSRIKMRDLGKKMAKTVGETPCVTFGRYKGVPYNGLLPYQLDKDGVITVRGEKYVVEEGSAFVAADIEWLCISCHGDEAVLVSEKILAQRTGGPELINWLNSVFLRCAFTEEERACLKGDVALVGERDIAAADSRDFLIAADSERIPEKQWWLGAYGIGIMQKVVREDGSVYNNGYNSRMKKSGVRPLIRVNMKDLLALNEKNN